MITGCQRQDPASQKALFMAVYDFGMSIAARYAKNLAEAEEIANDGFLKMLQRINLYRSDIPFKLWLRRIIINCGIDHYRKHYKRHSERIFSLPTTTYNEGATQLEGDYLIQLIQQLPAQYRIVFVLHVIEGFSHEEIAHKLGITKGTSKSNLAKARKKLQAMIITHNQQVS